MSQSIEERTPSKDSEVDSIPVSKKDSAGAERREEYARLLNHAMARLGPGPYQLVVLLLGGGVYAAEGSLLLMLSIIAKGLIAKWNLSPLLAGAMATIIFIGLLTGTISGGFACDRIGRRTPILVTYLGIVVFIILGIFSPGLMTLVSAKFMLGFFLGFGVPAANALVAESCPPAHRSNIYCLTMVLFSLGQLYSATIVWAMSPTLHHDEMEWRGMLLVSTLLPLILCVFAYFLLLESAHWLLVNDRVSEAKAVVRAMGRYKRFDQGTQDPALAQEFRAWEEEELDKPLKTKDPELTGGPVSESDNERTPLLSGEDGTPTPRAIGVAQRQWQCGVDFMKDDLERVRGLFSPFFRKTTLIMLFVTFATNFGYYGMIYGLPDTLRKASVTASNSPEQWSPAAGIFFSAASEIPGVFIAITLGATVGRRLNMSFAFFMTAISLLVVVYALGRGRITDNFGMTAVLSAKLWLAAGYIVVYLYLLECYPTRFRATGLAFCMVLGRLGAFLCPIVFDGMTIMGVDHVWYFAIMSLFLFLASVICCFLPYETKDAELAGDVPPPASAAVEPDLVGQRSSELLRQRKSSDA